MSRTRPNHRRGRRGRRRRRTGDHRLEHADSGRRCHRVCGRADVKLRGPSPWGFRLDRWGASTTTDSLEPYRPAVAAGDCDGGGAGLRVVAAARVTAMWGRFWLRVQHRPEAGATVVMAVTGSGSRNVSEAPGRRPAGAGAARRRGDRSFGRATGARPAVPDRLDVADTAGSACPITGIAARPFVGSRRVRSGDHVQARHRRPQPHPSRRRDRQRRGVARARPSGLFAALVEQRRHREHEHDRRAQRRHLDQHEGLSATPVR